MNQPLDETGSWNGVSHIYRLALIKEGCCVCSRIFRADFWAPRPALLLSAYSESIFSLGILPFDFVHTILNRELAELLSASSLGPC